MTEAKTSGIAISFPKEWKILNLSAGDVDKVLEDAFGSDPQYANAKAQTKQVAANGMFKLFAFAPDETPAKFRPNCNVIVNDLPAEMTMADLTKANAEQLKPMLADGTEVKVSDFEGGAGKLGRMEATIKSPQYKDGLASTTYLAMKGKTLAVITFTTSMDKSADMLKTSEDVMKTFKFE